MKKYVLLLPSAICTCILGLVLLYSFLSNKDSENESIYSIAGIIFFYYIYKRHCLQSCDRN